MTVFEMAKKYYPRLWGRDRIDALTEAGRLTEEERSAILGVVSNLDTALKEEG